MIDQHQIQAFTQLLRHLGILFMKVAGQQSTAHATFNKQELMALGVLGIRGACRMGEIAEHLGVGQSAITPLVDRLEAQGVARRLRSREDRRVWLVELTQEGEAVFEAEEKVYQQMARELLAPLSTSERETLITLLEHVKSAYPQI